MIRLVLKNQINSNKQKALLLLRRQEAHSQPYVLEAGLGKAVVLLSPFILGGAVAAYAKHDPEFRKSLVQTVPLAEPILKVVLQEEGNAVSEATKSISNASQKVVGLKDTVVGFFGGETEEKLKAPKPSITAKSSSSSSVAPPPLPPLTTTEPQKPAAQKKETNEAKRAPTTIPAAPAPSPPIHISPAKPQSLPASLVELEKSLEIAAQTAVKEYNNAIKHLKEYSEDVKKVVDRVIEHGDHTVWSLLKNKTHARDTAVDSAERSALEARNQIEKLEKHVTNVSKDVSPEVVEKTRRKIRIIADELNKTKDDLYNAKDSANISEKYWNKVEEARNYFVDQIHTLFPGIDLSSKKLNLGKDDIDLLIMHAYSHVLAYQKELQRMQIDGEIRLRRALDALRGEDQTEAVNSQLEYLLEKEKQQLNIDNQKKILHLQLETETKLRQQLKKQSEAHADHLEDAVKEKEKELKRVFNRELNEKLSIEQAAFKLQLATMLGKLKGMDAALKEIDEELKARVDADRQIHQAQALWGACSALWSSTRSSDSKVAWQAQLKPLSNEVEAVKEAAEGDELVKIVLDGIPAEAKNRGVYPESAIRERFLKVEKLARKLALVKNDDDGIPTYVLSYLQAALIVQPKELISAAELNNEHVNVYKLNTFDILDRTRYFVDRGNFIQALKYANLLQGASRKVASDWINETKLLLETQQAVNVLLAHAATSGLLFL